MAFQPFDYMAWAKAHQGRYPHDLSVSGMAPPSPAELSLDFAALDLRGLDDAARAAARQAIAAEYGVSADQVVLAAGASEANFIVCLSLLAPGDTVLAERPGYQAQSRIGSLFGTEIRHFERRAADGYGLDLAALRAAWCPRVRLVMLSMPHNPSGAGIDAATLIELGEWLERHDAYALVDEVYRDFVPAPPPVAQALHPRLITTASLTKVYGLGALRLGWALMPAALARRAEQLYDFMAVNPAAPSWRLALQAWPHLPALRRRAQQRAAENRAELAQWLADQPFVRGSVPAHGIVALVALPRVEAVKALDAWLREEHGVLIAPGDYFGAPGTARLAFGATPERLSAALAALAAGLRSYPRR